MDQLHLSLISTDLKYTLSSMKIKTLEKAREYFVQQIQAIEEGVFDYESGAGVVDKLEKIKKYLAKYDSVRSEVSAKINFVDDQMDKQDNSEFIEEQNNQYEDEQQKETNNNNQAIKHSIPSFTDQSSTSIQKLFILPLTKPSITQISGQKGSGKTVLLLKCCELYSLMSQKKVYFINCAGGVSHGRFERLSRMYGNLEYRDSYELEHVLKVCESAMKDEQTGCVMVDSLTNLLMEEEKTLVFLLKLFKLFTTLIHTKQTKIIYTNYVQQVFEHNENEHLTNHYTYYSSVTSEFIDYKYYVRKHGRNGVQLRMIRGGCGRGEFGIGRDGVKDDSRVRIG